jgi:hypothetical protein
MEIPDDGSGETWSRGAIEDELNLCTGRCRAISLCVSVSDYRTRVPKLLSPSHKPRRNLDLRHKISHTEPNRVTTTIKSSRTSPKRNRSPIIQLNSAKLLLL